MNHHEPPSPETLIAIANFSQILPGIPLLICRFVAGAVDEASTAGIIAYLVILVLGLIWLVRFSLFPCLALKMNRRVKIVILQLIIWIGLTVFTIVQLVNVTP